MSTHWPEHPNAQGPTRWVAWAVAIGLFSLSLAVYCGRMAPSVVPGDPGEYQLIATQWGIGHPPGYGFYALVGNIFTRLVPVGAPAWRANLLSAVCGALIVVLTYGAGRILCEQRGRPVGALVEHGPAFLGALALGAGIDLWQHAIHANAHIVTALLATITLFCLLRWWQLDQAGQAGRDRWLLAACFVAGLSPVQHPLLVFAFPAYVVFVVAVRPRLWRQWHLCVRMAAMTLLGLAAYLYYPIRCAIGAPPAPGPSEMHTWAGFVNVVTAQGLRVNLFQFSPGQLAQRLWDVRVPLGLQYSWPLLALAGLGLVYLWARRWKPALLLSAFVLGITAITVNVLQDEMAYLLGPMVVLGIWVGLGIDVLMRWLSGAARRRWVSWAFIALVGALPVWAAVVNWDRMSLRSYREADDWLAEVSRELGGQGKQVALLTEWERMTTVYYYTAAEQKMRQEGGTWVWEGAGVRFVPTYAGAKRPFLDEIETYLPQGPVYLTTYLPGVAAAYRLVPNGAFWRVLPSWPRDLPADAHSVDIVAEDRFEIVGWRLDQDVAQPGDVLSLDLYMRMPNPEGVDAQRYYLPWAKLGQTTYRFTTDSRFHTPWWQPGEIVVERFSLPVSWLMEPGAYPLQVGVQLDAQDLELQDGDSLAPLAEVLVRRAEWTPSLRELDAALGSLNGQILLRGARVNGKRVPADKQIEVQPGQVVRVALDWESLVPIQENYTVFVQVLDTSYRVWAQDDITPLGGSAPTWLWFPRWRRGMRIVDTHLLRVPADMPPGQYPLVVGMYGFTTHKRVQVVSSQGDMAGDWITLTHLWVQ